MKPRTMIYSVVAVCMAVFAFTPPNRVTAQSDLDTAAGTELLQAVQAQQVTLADNQKQIDAKLVVIAEALRTARIYVSRGGK